AGSVMPSLFIFSPNGTAVASLMPIYRLENAPALPVHVQVAPPLSFSLPWMAPVHCHPWPGVAVGPPVMTVAAPAGELPIDSSPTTASVATRTTAEPWRLRRTGVAVQRTVRVCELPPCD